MSGQTWTYDDQAQTWGSKIIIVVTLDTVT